LLLLHGRQFDPDAFAVHHRGSNMVLVTGRHGRQLVFHDAADLACATRLRGIVGNQNRQLFD